MKAYVDKDKCIGCGMCAGLEPDVFRMGDDGLAEAYAEADETAEDNVRQAIDMCPVEAIEEQ